MPRRPPSAANRPQTAQGGGRPTTAGVPPGPNVFDRDPQYTYDQDYIEEEQEEESEDEDVFAFLPPSTAEQQQEQHQREADNAQLAPVAAKGDSGEPVFSHNVPAPVPAPPASFHPDSSLNHTDSPGSIPPTAFHPTPGPSSQITYQTPPTPFLTPVETPPSTGSHSDVNSTNPNANSYRLRRLNTEGTANSRRSRTSAVSMEVHLDLPELPSTAQGIEKESTEKIKYGEKEKSQTAPAQMVKTDETRRRNKRLRSPGSIMDSVNGSMSYTPSMVDEETPEGSIKMDFDFDAIDEEDSPFPEVRASVSNIDDPEMPALTLRMWFVGMLLCMTSSAMNVFFNFRQPAPSIVPLALLLISYPFGKFMAFTLPITTYRIPLPRPFSPIVFSFNPGPWNIKEHVLVFIMANVAVGPPYAMNAIVVSEIFYELKLGYWFNLTLVLATQLTGFGLAGLCRRFLVWPASMVWPQNLVVCTLLNTLHAEDEDGTGGITRYKYFMMVLGASFFFFFLPGFLFQALSIFSFICWIVPNNVPVNQLFGVDGGLGMSFVTFDWVQITWIGSPLMVPWWAEVHIFTGFVLFYWILTPVLYYTNVWELAHFPLSANAPYDRFGLPYNVTRVLQTDDTFNLTAYEEYSELYLPATYAVTYLLAFALSTCVIVHTALYHGRSLLNGVKRIRIEEDDIHAKLMRNYPEVPDWWYLFAFVFFFCCAIIAVEVWGTNVPVWALLLSLLLPTIYILPSGFIYAMTGQGITLNVLAQIIPGSLLPGKPLANMVFKAYSVQTLAEATNFVQDLKLGHYVKVPPRATFLVQAIATILAAFIQVGVKEWIFANVPDVCTRNQKSSLTCPHNQVFFTASAVWGLIGPSRQFGVGSLYHPQLYAILIGAFLPVPFWLWQRRYPNSWVKFISTPVVLNGVNWIPPATGINYSSWFAVGFIFQYLIRKRNFAWWSKFNYVTSAAMDSGTVLSLLLIFFTLQLPKNGALSPNWWGNTVFQDTADWKKTPFLAIPPGGIPPL